MILLPQYHWNLSDLVADFESMMKFHHLLTQCPEVIQTNVGNHPCSLCQIDFPCYPLSCGHYFCVPCISGSCKSETTSSVLLLLLLVPFSSTTPTCLYLPKTFILVQCYWTMQIRVLIEEPLLQSVLLWLGGTRHM